MNIGFILFDDVTQLDAMGPLQFLSRMPDAQTVTIAKSLAPVKTDCPVCLIPTHSFDTAPNLDLLCITGGGVTAGIDFALTVIAAIKGDDVSQSLQLGLEYNPEPPFSSGSPSSAPSRITKRLTDFYQEPVSSMRDVLENYNGSGKVTP